MKKVLVIGCPGSGKSTLSRALQKRTQLPLFYLDRMNWNPDRTTVEREVFRKRLQAVLQQEEWIIDGNYASTMELRLQACDTVIFLDYPTQVCLDGVRERQGKSRPDMPWIETQEDSEFIEFIERYHQESRPQVMQLLEKYADKKNGYSPQSGRRGEFLKSSALIGTDKAFLCIFLAKSY